VRLRARPATAAVMQTARVPQDLGMAGADEFGAPARSSPASNPIILTRTAGPPAMAGTGRPGGEVAGGSGARAELCRRAAAAPGRVPADAGGAGRGGWHQLEVGQRLGARHQPHRAQGHRCPACRCAEPDRAGPGGVCRGGTRAGTRRGGPRGPGRGRGGWWPGGRWWAAGRGGADAAAGHREFHRAGGGPGPATGRSRRPCRRRNRGDPRHRRHGGHRQDHLRRARRAPARQELPRRAVLPAAARPHARPAAG
jgi:hypothetical protein